MADARAPQPETPISLVMLAYNEAATIEDEVRAYHQAIITKLPGSEFIVAEDGSSDGTAEILQRLQGELGIIHLTGKERKGYARAFREAVLATRQPYVFFSDTGMKHDPREFWQLYAQREAYDLIVGRKTHRQDQWYRQWLTAGYNLLLRRYFQVAAVYDADSGFRLFNRRVVEKIFRGPLLFTGFIGSEIVLRTIYAGLRYVEVPVSYRLRRGASRGLPLAVIPREIVKVLRSLRRLRAELGVGS